MHPGSRPMDEKKPPNPVLVEKQQMFAAQESRREQANPIRPSQAAAFGRALLARLEKTPNRHEPARVTMSGPPPLADDVIPNETSEPLGGCFADIAEEDADD